MSFRATSTSLKPTGSRGTAPAGGSVVSSSRTTMQSIAMKKLENENYRLKHENVSLSARVTHFETMFAKKKDKTAMDKHIALFSQLLHKVQIAKQESQQDKNLGKNQLKEEIRRLYKLLQAAKEDVLSKMDQLVQSDRALDNERAARNQLMDELTSDRKIFVQLLNEDRKRYIETLMRVQNGGEHVVIDEHDIFGEVPVEKHFGKKKRKYRIRPKTSDKNFGGGRGRSQGSSRPVSKKETRMSGKIARRPNTAGSVGRRRPSAAGRSITSGSSEEKYREIIASRPPTTSSMPSNRPNSGASSTNSNLRITIENNNKVEDRAQEPVVPISPPATIVPDNIFESSSEVAFSALEPRPPRRPIMLEGDKKSAGGIRRRIISGPSSTSTTVDESIIVADKENDTDDVMIKPITPSRRVNSPDHLTPINVSPMRTINPATRDPPVVLVPKVEVLEPEVSPENHVKKQGKDELSMKDEEEGGGVATFLSAMTAGVEDDEDSDECTDNGEEEEEEEEEDEEDEEEEEEDDDDDDEEETVASFSLPVIRREKDTTMRPAELV